MKKYENYIIFLIVIVFVAVLLFFISPFERKVPEGLPTHYYELVDSASNSDTKILIYSDEINLNDHVRYEQLISLNDVYSFGAYQFVFLIIDMGKYDKNYSDTNLINDIYNNSCITIVIVNYRKSETEESIEFLDLEDLNSDLVFTKNNDFCNTDYLTNTIGNEFPGNEYLNFAIIHHISLDRDSNIE